jgi:threonine synthase
MKIQEKYYFECLKCNKKFGSKNDGIQLCPKCSYPVSVQMDLEHLKEIVSKKQFYAKKIASMWSFFEFLPLLEEKNIVSLIEGNTSSLRSNRMARELNLDDLFLKLEFLNPTGSFKDRQISMAISKAVELNQDSVITMSSGNVGASVAAYSARVGLKNIILIPEIAPQSKIIQIMAYGGNVVKIKSDSTKFISQIVQKASIEFNMANLITAAIYNPFSIKGAKTISYEITVQSKAEKINFPDVIIVPVGGSGLLTGLYEGFEELYKLDFIDHIPKLIAVQPKGCAPFVKAIKNKLSPEYLFNNPWKKIETISTALADDIPLDCYTGIPAIKNSGGDAIAVSDEDTLKACNDLSRLEGIFAEPSSCTTIAALKILTDESLIKNDEIVYCMITGTGFKDTKSIQSTIPEYIIVERDFNWKELFKDLLI